MAAAVASAVLLPLTYLLGGVLVRFATDRGEVVIAVDDPDTEVTVKEGAAVILDGRGQRRITLTAGEHDLEVSVKDASGEVRFPFNKTIVLSRGGKEIVNIREELARTSEKRALALADSSKQADPVVLNTRQVASRVLSLGGKLKIAGTNGEQFVRAAKELPANDFRIVGIDLGRTGATDADLTILESQASLVEIALDGTHVTDAGVVHLAGLKNLQRLNLAATVVSDSGLAHLESLTSLQESRPLRNKDYRRRA